jgi:hypothetical protein
MLLTKPFIQGHRGSGGGREQSRGRHSSFFLFSFFRDAEVAEAVASKVAAATALIFLFSLF